MKHYVIELMRYIGKTSVLTFYCHTYDNFKDYIHAYVALSDAFEKAQMYVACRDEISQDENGHEWTRTYFIIK